MRELVGQAPNHVLIKQVLQAPGRGASSACSRSHPPSSSDGGGSPYHFWRRRSNVAKIVQSKTCF
eukprot:758240-Pyramimonas_sp.AAC.1